MRHRCLRFIVAVAIVAVISPSGFAVVSVRETGNWPDSWPKELEPLRTSARTVDIATGIQETLHEIRFEDRAAFEKVWPLILSLKTPGAPLKLSPIGSKSSWGKFLSNAAPVVRISAPSLTIDFTGLKDKKGELPEYIEQRKDGQGKQEWAPADIGKPPRGFFYRARVDVELVVDGKVIDLNRIALPPDTPIVDKRFESTTAK